MDEYKVGFEAVHIHHVVHSKNDSVIGSFCRSFFGNSKMLWASGVASVSWVPRHMKLL